MVLDMVGMLSFAVPAAVWSWTWSVMFAIVGESSMKEK